MYDFIPSSTVREYLEKIGHTFTDSEKATMIYNLGQDVLDTHRRLRELAASTEDCKLREQITGLLAYEEACIRKVSQDDTPGYLYEVSFREDHNDRIGMEGCFTSFELARRFARQEGRRYAYIEKHLPVSSLEGVDGKDPYLASRVGYMIYIDGILSYFDSTECSKEEFAGKESSGQETFEYQYVEIPLPFKKGDIVSFPGDNPGEREVGIVMGICSPEEREECNKDPGPFKGDWSDTFILVETPYLGREFCHTHISACTAELYELNEGDPDKKILEAAQALVQSGGCGSFEYFQMCL